MEQEQEQVEGLQREQSDSIQELEWKQLAHVASFESTT